ncbi:MAG: cytidylate kinase-like family protein [Candidatus Omnitrophica bacterium]|nr:cytidylate kinase-like family protein [Candidatus Omnitrophota bacterium]MDE2010031.1 cytidylate kinase-like family protein [Candidatus Omnitrophota bacterium]MDE2214734.1 cytidylate kinase-like family protein [Candidatus Omnitrophota bacterium]
MNDYTSYIHSQAKKLREDPQKNRRTNRPYVTISRQTGAYGLTVARKLCEYLQKNERREKCPWTVFDKEVLKKVVDGLELPETVLPYMSESTISEVEDLMEELFGLHPSRYLLVHETSETILQLAQLGYAIIIGRASGIITAKVPGGVHVRLISPLEKRIEHMQEYLKVSKKEAREFVLKKDRNRRDYVKKYFGKDNADPLLYDLVINVDAVGPQETARLIGGLVLKQF